MSTCPTFRLVTWETNKNAVIRAIIHSFIQYFVWYRSKASSKMMPPHSVVQSLLLQMRIFSPFLKRDYIINKLTTRLNIYVLMGELWLNVRRTQEVFLYSLHHDDIAHIAVQLQPNDRFSNCVLLYWLYKLYCSGRLEKLHRGNGCSRHVLVPSRGHFSR